MPENAAVLYAGASLDQNDSFRLLCLKKGQGDKPLRMRLLNTRLSDAPAYETVSYIWGDATQTSEVHVVNQLPPDQSPPGETETTAAGTIITIIQVTANCHAVLRRLRRADSDRTLWVDSVCIN